MLSLLDKLLRRVLVDGATGLGSSNLVSEEQVFFVPPDTQWRTAHLPPAYATRLSVYLVDVRENVKLRSNERVERQTGTAVAHRRMPYRMDCHYLVTAVANTGGGAPPPPPSQHAVLYEVTAALIRSQPLIPARVYPPGSAELGPWADFRDVELPMTVNPHEGFPKLAEFWGTLKDDHPWQPVVYVVVTIPVEYEEGPLVGRVRRRTTIYASGVATETYAEIGGAVVTSGQEPVGRAWVMAGSLAGADRVELARTIADDEGTFILRLPTAATHIWAAAFGVGLTAPLEVSMASPTSSTDFTLRFT